MIARTAVPVIEKIVAFICMHYIVWYIITTPVSISSNIDHLYHRLKLL